MFHFMFGLIAGLLKLVFGLIAGIIGLVLGLVGCVGGCLIAVLVFLALPVILLLALIF